MLYNRPSVSLAPERQGFYRLCNIRRLRGVRCRTLTQGFYQCQGMWARSAGADFSVIHLDHRHHTFVGAGYENFVRPEKLFQRQVPDFEKMLVRSGIQLFKYWFSVTREEQMRRFEARSQDPLKQWKLSPMDLKARSHWIDYSKARDAMLARTNSAHAPWYLVDANVKRHARLNIISHLLSKVPYKDVTPEPLELPARQKAGGYSPPDFSGYHFVPTIYP